MKTVLFRSIVSLLVVGAFFGSVATLTASAAGPNLISNPSLETASGSNPQDWSPKNYGLSSFFVTTTYPVAGVNGGKAAKVDLKFNIGIPVGWQPKSVTVIPGHTYTFSDSSLGTVASSIDIVSSNYFGVVAHLGDMGANANFTTFTTSYKVPAGITSITILHSIKKPGSLTVDEFSLVDTGAVADTQAPTVSVSSPTPNQALANTVNLTANATDNGGGTVSGVKFYVDNVLIGAEDIASPYSVSFDTKTVTNTAHSVVAVARDNSGNVATSSPVSFTVNNPAPTAQLTVTVTVTNDGGGARSAVDFPLFLNGMPITSGVATTTAPGTYTVTETTNAGYTLTISGSCAANGSITLALNDSKSCTFNNNDIDATAPTVSITSPTAGQVASSTIPLSANATDAGGVAGVTFYIDNANVGTEDTTAPYSVNFDTKTITNAGHSIVAVARDTTGNRATSTAVAFTVNNPTDTTGPTVSVTNPTSGQVASSTINLTANATDASGIAGVKFYIDNVLRGSEDISAPYSVAFDTKTISNAGHSIVAVARDTLGNVSTSTAVSFSVNNVALPTTGKLTVTIAMVNNNGGSASASNFALFLNGMAIQNGVATTTAPGMYTLTQNGPTGYTTVISGACAANGSVTIAAGDNKSCTVTNDDVVVTPPSNLIQNGNVESGTTGAPTGWQQGGWGTNTPIYTYPATSPDGSKALKVELTSYTNGDLKWFFNPITGLAGKTVHYSEQYQSNIASNITIQYQLTDGTFSYLGLQDLPAAPSGTTFSADISVPANVANMTVFHVIAAVGWLITDNYSMNIAATVAFDQPMISLAFDDSLDNQYDLATPILNAAGIKASFYIITQDGVGINTDGQMTTAQVLALQTQGHEVAAHTRTHPHLPTLTLQQMTDEISGSRQDLINMGITHVDTFTYPYGEYNDQVVQAVKNAGYIGARSVNEGYDNKASDKFLLLDQHVESQMTLATLKGEIDQAIANNQWIIFELHQQVSGSCGSEQYCNTTATLQGIVDYIKQKNLKTVTLSEGIKLMNP